MAQYRYQGHILVKKTAREDYAFAVIDTHEEGKIYKVFISTTRAKVEAMRNTAINQYYRNIENCNRAIEAIKAGKSSYMSKFNGRTYWTEIDKKGIPHYEEWIEHWQKSINYINDNWHIVEVEKV